MSATTVPEWVKDAVFCQVFPDTFARSDLVPKPGNLRPWQASPNRRGSIYEVRQGHIVGAALPPRSGAVLRVT